jgi:hypothetical protein
VRSFEMQHRCSSLLFYSSGPTAHPPARACRAAPVRLARAVPVPARRCIRRARAIARRRSSAVRRYAARGVETHATIIIQRTRDARFLVFYPSPRGARDGATRLGPPKRGSRVADGSRAPAARSRARSPHRHPVADRAHPRRASPTTRCQLRPCSRSGRSRRIAIRNAWRVTA